MAKTIITQDGSAVNYDNILAVYIEENTYKSAQKGTFFKEKERGHACRYKNKRCRHQGKEGTRQDAYA